MFEKFSVRSRQVVFAARFKAGERGANAIDTNDLLVSLVLEDQGLLLTKQFLSSVFGEEGDFASEVPIHPRFLPVEVAGDVLANLHMNQNESEPVPTFVELPLSTSLECVFKSANILAASLQHKQIEPLHLLAAILTDDSGDGAKLLQSLGITKKKVLAAIRHKDRKN
jgi:ATP-dependent Clp protease ATP-binding subunit ClpA